MIHKVILNVDESHAISNKVTECIGNYLSVNYTLVQLGYADFIPGSALDLEWQADRTIDNDDTEALESLGKFLSIMNAILYLLL